MADAAAMHDSQPRLSLATDKQRLLEMRQNIVQGLRQRVERLTEECRRQEDRAQGLAAQYEQRRAEQDARVSAKEEHIRMQQNEVSALESAVRLLREKSEHHGMAIEEAQKELARRQALRKKVEDAQKALTQLKQVVEDRDARMVALELRVDREKTETERRHEQLEGWEPHCSLPRIEDVGRLGLDETAGESIVLVGDLA
uniref:Uncharacterized protein n=1 Tax=Trypanosoma congolense (strain IL3000) TaxID=1068625 RepID=G0URC3_TRYCI|nr:conserved hypothetical protein [Trypanosoma congolense IL3000]